MVAYRKKRKKVARYIVCSECGNEDKVMTEKQKGPDRSYFPSQKAQRLFPVLRLSSSSFLLILNFFPFSKASKVVASVSMFLVRMSVLDPWLGHLLYRSPVTKPSSSALFPVVEISLPST